jgi:hypothetical protein
MDASCGIALEFRGAILLGADAGCNDLIQRRYAAHWGLNDRACMCSRGWSPGFSRLKPGLQPRLPNSARGFRSSFTLSTLE